MVFGHTVHSIGNEQHKVLIERVCPGFEVKPNDFQAGSWERIKDSR